MQASKSEKEGGVSNFADLLNQIDVNKIINEPNKIAASKLT
jgi:hypothetical protein